MNTIFTNMAQKWDLTGSQYPGIYEILDLKNNMSYYGESDCLCRRYGQHLRELRNGTHYCKSLLQSFQSQNEPDGFKFFALEWGPSWDDKNLRIQRQDEYILANKSRCYNTADAPQQRSLCPIRVNGKTYPSIRAAVREEKIARTTLIRYLDDPKNYGFVYLIEQKQRYSGCIPIFGQKKGGPSVLFESYKECVDAGYATNSQNARRKIQKKELGWRYAHLDEYGKPLRVPYSLKPGEVAYKDLKKEFF
jgi:hypothetical protein